MKLNPEQLNAATAPGNAAVTAGAGTGKTSMLAARYVHHVQTEGHSPLSVVAVTFTNKAADELRSRIRKALNDAGTSERIVAEVEAAQISTIHALAARICRDFYDLAGIPPDFTVLDEADAPLKTAEIFDRAVGGLDPAIVSELGFAWLTSVLQELLADPYSAEKALRKGSSFWKAAIDEECLAAVEDLRSSDCWADALEVMRSCNGRPGDRLEDIRSCVLAAMERLADGAGFQELDQAFRGFRSNSGASANWSPDDLARVRACLSSLRTKLKELFNRATLSFGDADAEAARRLPLVDAAFRQVLSFISTEKLREKLLDFDDLERYALKILTHDEAAEHYALRWKAFLVDEFQDTNPIQAELLARLTSGATLTVVGDEKQAIYGFRGADTELFSRVRDEIVADGGVEVPLDVTYRSHEELVASMNSIFEPVLGPISQSLRSGRGAADSAGPYVTCSVVAEEPDTSKKDRQFVEAAYIAECVKELHENGVEYRDMAILARAWAPLNIYLDVLSAKGIPAIHAGGGSLLDTREGADIFALFGFLAEPNDDIPLVALLRSPFFGVSDTVLFHAAGRMKDVSWWMRVRNLPEFQESAAVLNELVAGRSQLSAARILKLADRLTGYSAIAANLPHGDRRAADIRAIYDLLYKFERSGRGDTFSTYRHMRELIRTGTEVPRPPLEPGNAVNLMTIHKSKGMEWPVVFLPDLVRDNRGDRSTVLLDEKLGVAFTVEDESGETAEPAIFRLLKDRAKTRGADEERRILYVALTRARDRVILTAAKPAGFPLEILLPGLEAACISLDTIPYDAALSIPPEPMELYPFPIPESINVEPISAALREVPVTALSAYASCPKRFEYQYILDHPGVSEGGGNARAIGSLTHLALEHGLNSADELSREAIEHGRDLIEAAIALANKFREFEGYRQFQQGGGFAREKSFRFVSDGLHLSGIADLVGPDFVLDYKTDAEMNPAEHRFQLWAYARALNKPKAYIAYLRHDHLHVFDETELERTELEARAMIGRIRDGQYDAVPAERNCGICTYGLVCGSRFIAEDSRGEVSETS